MRVVHSTVPDILAAFALACAILVTGSPVHSQSSSLALVSPLPKDKPRCVISVLTIVPTGPTLINREASMTDRPPRWSSRSVEIQELIREILRVLAEIQPGRPQGLVFAPQCVANGQGQAMYVVAASITIDEAPSCDTQKTCSYSIAVNASVCSANECRHHLLAHLKWGHTNLGQSVRPIEEAIRFRNALLNALTY